MDILVKALSAHRAGNAVVCSNALARADQLGLLDPTLAFRTAAVKFICGLLPVEELLNEGNFSEVEINTLGWAAQETLADNPEAANSLATAMSSYGARFKVLALRAQAALCAIDPQLLLSTPPRALERALGALEGASRAHLQVAAAFFCDDFQHLASEALETLTAQGQTSFVLDAAARLYEKEQNSAIAAAAALAAGVARLPEARDHWLSLCVDHDAAFVRAATAPSAANWSTAASALLNAGLHGLEFAKAASSAAAFGISEETLSTWASEVSFTEPSHATRFAGTLASAGLVDEALAVLTPHLESPLAALLFVTLDPQSENSLELARSVAASRSASPAQILEAVEFLLSRGQQPVGPLLALLRSTETPLDAASTAAHLLVGLVADGVSRGESTAKALLSVSERFPVDSLERVRWLFAAARCGSAQAAHLLSQAADNPRLSGWASLALAEVALQKRNHVNFVAAISDSHTAAVVAGDSELSAAIQDCVNRASR